MKRYTYFFIFMICFTFYSHGTPIYSTKTIDQTSKRISLYIPLTEKDAVYKKYLSISVDHPSITLSAWKSDSDPIKQYDPVFKTTKEIFTKPFTITLHATANEKISNTNTSGADIADANIHVYLYKRSKKQIKEYIFPLAFNAPQRGLSPITKKHTTKRTAQPPALSILPQKAPKQPFDILAYIDVIAVKTQSFWLHILVVLFLGISLSFTPCTYPMVPITVGILQGHLKKLSYLNCFLTSLWYTIGLASVFGALGIFAAYAGRYFSTWITTPIFALVVVAILFYCAFSMLGFYPLYIPRALRQRKAWTKGGSFISAFSFGVASGSVATPCLAPGLVLLLTLVAQEGNITRGGILLFVFGIGVSLPLLIVGTAPKIMHYLPQAGTWMIDINKLFGIILFGTIFYFLHGMVVWHILLTLISIFIALIGIYYIFTSERTQTTLGKRFKGVIGIALIVHSILLYAASYKAKHVPQIVPKQQRKV